MLSHTELWIIIALLVVSNLLNIWLLYLARTMRDEARDLLDQALDYLGILQQYNREGR